MPRLALLPALLLSCWAPEVAVPGEEQGPPGGEVQAPGARTEAWPTPPFAAWTARAPASIVGPGGTPLALLERQGVRVEVVQVLPVRARLRCAGCEGEAAGLEGWLQADALWWPGAAPLPLQAPLRRALELRAAWAAGQALPEGAGPEVDADALCALVDAGFRGSPPVWERGSARLSLAMADGHWLPARLEGSPPPAPGACAAAAPAAAPAPAPPPPPPPDGNPPPAG